MNKTPEVKTAMKGEYDDGLTYSQRYYRSHKKERSKWYRDHKEERRLYTIWVSMKTRCANKNNKYYGGKNISVCDEWMDYNTFEKWALENGYNYHN